MAIWQRDDRDFFLSPIDGLWDQGYLIICSDPGDITTQPKLLLYSQTEGVKQRYLLYNYSIGSKSQVFAICNVQIYKYPLDSQQ